MSQLDTILEKSGYQVTQGATPAQVQAENNEVAGYMAARAAGIDPQDTQPRDPAPGTKIHTRPEDVEQFLQAQGQNVLAPDPQQQQQQQQAQPEGGEQGQQEQQQNSQQAEPNPDQEPYDPDGPNGDWQSQPEQNEDPDGEGNQPAEANEAEGAADGGAENSPADGKDVKMSESRLQQRLERARKAGEKSLRDHVDNRIGDIEKKIDALLNQQTAKAAPDPGKEPLIADFDTVAEWQEAYGKWEEAKAAHAKAPAPTQSASEPESKEQGEQQLSAEEIQAIEYAKIVHEILDEKGPDDSDLSQQVREMAQDNRLVASATMMEALATEFTEEDTVKVIQVFVSQPRTSRRISLMAESEQVKAMRNLIQQKPPSKKGGAGNQKQTQQPSQQQQQVSEPIRSNGGVRSKSVYDKRISTGDYLALRAEQQRTNPLGLNI